MGHEEESSASIDATADTILAGALNSLSLEERNRVYESIHGVDDITRETPEFLSQKLVEMDKLLELVLLPYDPASRSEIQKDLTREERETFLLANKENQGYIKDEGMRLMFLRAEDFNVKESVLRMLRYHHQKLIRFGKDALTRPLQLDDLCSSAMSLMKDYGVFQILQCRDTAGRALLLVHSEPNRYRHLVREKPQASVDLAFYMLSIVAEEEETQKRGLVLVFNFAGLPGMEDVEDFRKNHKHGDLSKIVPIKIKAIHCWLKLVANNPFMKMLFTNVISDDNKAKIRVHATSYTELKYKLLSFGIPPDALPYTLDGEEIRLQGVMKWIERRKKKENMLKSGVKVAALDLPGCRDVCLGRGSTAHQQAGNVFMRAIMSGMLEEYRVSNTKERRVLNQQLVNKVRAAGGRFIERTSVGWYEEVEDEKVILGKVAGSFRGMVSRITPAADLDRQREKASGLHENQNLDAKRSRVFDLRS